MKRIAWTLMHAALVPVRVVWNVVVFLLIMVLQVVWLGMLCGSVVGLILALIFLPSVIFAPAILGREMLVGAWPGLDYKGEKVDNE